MTIATKGYRAMTRTGYRRGVLAGAVALGLLALGVVGCSTTSILNVTDPDIINPGDVSTPDGAVALYNGAIGQFAYANAGNAGGTEGQILVSGMFTDEYHLSGTFPTRLEYDQRAISDKNGTLEGVFRDLQRARSYLEHAAVALEASAPTPGSRVGEVFSLAGYTYITMAENYCEGVPISDYALDGTITYGPTLNRADILARALADFDSSDAVTSDADIANLAAVGRARALVDEGNFAQAAAAVTAVPTNFQYVNTHSTNSGFEQNGVYVFNWQSGRWSVSDNEGVNGLDYRSAGDPRVVTTDAGPGFDGNSELYGLNKYAGPSSSIVVADGIEARLIEAEAMLQNGDGPGMVNALNALRADAADNGGFNLPALTDPGTTDGRVDMLFRERAFWLFATGHRLGDMRRLVRQYGRSADAVFPSGPYFKGGNYGTDVNLPVPFAEQNNPNFTGCLNRDP
ncbi:MAG TPA: hypothetical protein VJ992_02060 [Gemmatimonadales bacterium]|nr:hypothetical protein [Gemmatimonadales bacterium]